MAANSLTINYLNNGEVQFSDVRAHGFARQAIRQALRRMSITAPDEVDTMPLGHILDLGNGLAVQIVETDAAESFDRYAAAQDAIDARCDQCGSALPASRRCTSCN